MFGRFFKRCHDNSIDWKLRKLRKEIMATVQEVKDAFNAKLGLVNDQVTALEGQVEQLFAMIAALGNTPAELDTLKAEIETGFDNLGTNLAKVGEDDPSVP